MPGHLSDLLQFGAREAMRDFWQQPLIESGDLLNEGLCRHLFGCFTVYSPARRVLEQAILLRAMHKKGIKVHLGNPSQVTMNHLKLCDRVLSGVGTGARLRVLKRRWPSFSVWSA